MFNTVSASAATVIITITKIHKTKIFSFKLFINILMHVLPYWLN